MSSPTISIEAMMLSCPIDAKENRYIMVSDITGALLHADMEDNVHVPLEGTVADHKIRPNNIQKTHMVQQTWQTYVICTTKKALYGTLQAALLFWKLLSETLQEWGFVLNPSDKFVANKNIEGKQCTIIWHVDDLKISHANKDIVEDILKTKRQIQTRKSTHNMLWNGPRVPRHENQL